jgi:hypothetical protein
MFATPLKDKTNEKNGGHVSPAFVCSTPCSVIKTPGEPHELDHDESLIVLLEDLLTTVDSKVGSKPGNNTDHVFEVDAIGSDLCMSTLSIKSPPEAPSSADTNNNQTAKKATQLRLAPASGGVRKSARLAAVVSARTDTADNTPEPESIDRVKKSLVQKTKRRADTSCRKLKNLAVEFERNTSLAVRLFSSKSSTKKPSSESKMETGGGNGSAEGRHRRRLFNPDRYDVEKAFESDDLMNI